MIKPNNWLGLLQCFQFGKDKKVGNPNPKFPIPANLPSQGITIKGRRNNN